LNGLELQTNALGFRQLQETKFQHRQRSRNIPKELKRKNNLTAVRNDQGGGDDDHLHPLQSHTGVDVVDWVGGEALQPSVLTLQHQLQREQSPQALPLSKEHREENDTQ
jgi:hypothetical protein